MASSSLVTLLDETRRIVSRAGELLKTLRQQPREIRRKGRIDLVTETDVAVEEFLKKELAGLVPGAAFMAEESSESLVIPDCCWVIDPVDGTTNYAHGLPLVGISVAFYEGNDIQLGVVEIPLIGESWYACKGGGAFLNGSQVQTTKTVELGESLVATGFPYQIEEHLEAILARMRKVLPVARGVRRCGAASIDLAWLAGGRFDAYYEADLKPWDIAAGVCLLREAGGMVTHMDGNQFALGRDDILASNGNIHNAMLRLLAEASKDYEGD